MAEILNESPGLLSVAVIKTMVEINPGKTAFISSYNLQVTVHHRGKSGQEFKTWRWRPQGNTAS